MCDVALDFFRKRHGVGQRASNPFRRQIEFFGKFV